MIDLSLGDRRAVDPAQLVALPKRARHLERGRGAQDVRVLRRQRRRGRLGRGRGQALPRPQVQARRSNDQIRRRARHAARHDRRGSNCVIKCYKMCKLL